MKVIELLTKIANGEEVPKKIRYKNKSYIYSNECRGYYLGTNPERIETFAEFRLVKIISNGNMLNDEVEIIEEDKKIEKIENINIDYCVDGKLYEHLTKEEIALDIQTIRHKTDEIIDYINGGTND